MAQKTGIDTGWILRALPRAMMVAAVSAIVLVAACSDATGPEPVKPPEPTPTTPAVPAAMIAMAGDIDPMTEQFMPAVEDATAKSNLQGLLTGLKGHLTAGNVVLCQQDVTSARGVLSSLSDDQQVGVAPIGMALDVVDGLLTSLAK
jgi:hypothetical protein